MGESLIKAVPTNVIPALLGGFIVVFGLVSMFIKERMFLSEALVATIFGIIIGPICIGLMDPTDLVDIDSFTQQLARYVIALQVMAAGIELPKAYVFKEWKSMFMLLLPIMVIMWLVSGVIIHLVFQLPWLDSLIIASCVTPTDPILANSVIKGRFAEKRVPRGLRNILAAESGSNDGLGFPLLYLALFLMIYPNDLGTAIGKWFYLAWAYEVLLSVVIGATVGYAARKLLYLAESHCLIDKESFLSFSIALTLLLLGVVGLIASDDLLSVFCAGTAFAWDDWFRKETKEAHLQEVIDMLFNLTFFIYFGAIIPWHMYNIPAMNLHLWRFFVATICILIFRRLPALVLLCKFIPAIKTWREAIFAGWFGPIGVGALYYITVARRYMEDHDINPPSYDVIYPIVSFVVMGSVLVHGITIPLFHLGSALNTRTLTNNSVIGNFVSRLPMVRSGQNLELRRPDGEATSFTITGVKRLDDLDTEAAPSGRDGDKAGDGPAYAHVRELTIDAERNHHGSRTSTASPYYNGEDDEPEYLEIRVVESDQPFHGANSDDRTGSATQPHLHPPPNPTLRFEDLDNESSRLSSSLRGSPFLSADDSLSHKRSSVSFGQDGEK